MKTITNNTSQLTQEESQLIKKAKFYMYTYGVGLIFMDNCMWDCSDTVSAKQYLDKVGIKEQ